MEKYEIFEGTVINVKEVKFSDGSFSPANKTGGLLTITIEDEKIKFHNVFIPSYQGIDYGSLVRIYLPKTTSIESPSGSGDFVDFEHSREDYAKTENWTPSKLEILAKEGLMPIRTFENKHAVVAPHPYYEE